jgi:uncharacterized repeat protein (TIGR01451 family)
MLNIDGAALVYSTFLGGVQDSLYDNTERGYDVAFDPAGNAYISGVTDNTDFPTTPWAFAPELNWSVQGFVVKISGLGGTGQADLSITKTDSPDPAPLYGTLTYTITVTNDGPDDANAVSVTDTLPPNVVYMEASGGDGWFCEGSWGDSLITCSRALIAADTTAPALTIDVNVDSAGGPFTNTASVVAAENDPVPSNNTATAETLADVDDCANNDGDDYVACTGWCNPPAGLLCGDCNDWSADSYPGATEICDYDDNDCNGETDEGMGPEGYILLLMTANDSLSWSTLAGADACDVIRGDLNAMRAGFGNFSTSVCREDDLAGTTHLDTDVPILGEWVYYLIRGVDTSNGDCGGGSWDSGGAWQSVSRDPALGSWPCS